MARFLRIKKDFCWDDEEDVLPDDFQRFGDELIRVEDIRHVYLHMDDRKEIVYEYVDRKGRHQEMHETFKFPIHAIRRLDEVEIILNMED